MRVNAEILNKRVKLTNVDGLGKTFIENIFGTVISQSDINTCRIRLDKVLNDEEHSTGELIITARHEGFNLNKIVPRGMRKLLNMPPVVAVNATDDSEKIRFIAEIKLL